MVMQSLMPSDVAFIFYFFKNTLETKRGPVIVVKLMLTDRSSPLIFTGQCRHAHLESGAKSAAFV